MPRTTKTPGRGSGQPIYLQIAGILQGRIMSGWYPAGSRLASENTLARQFDVSRSTIRQAMQELQQLGFVEARRGSGTFVVEEGPGDPGRSLHASGPLFTGFLDDLLLQAAWIDDATAFEDDHVVDEELAGLLRHPAEEPVRRIRSVRSISGTPYGVSDDHLPPTIGDNLPAQSPECPTVLHRLAAGGFKPTSNHQRIEATRVPPDIAKLLRVAPGDPVICATGVGLDDEGRPIDAYRLWISPVYGLHLRFVRVGSLASSARMTQPSSSDDISEQGEE